MPNLSNIPGVQVGRSAPGLQIDPNSATASSRALESAGRAIVAVGEQAAAFSQQKQDHINKGLLAHEENIRTEFDAEMQQFMDSNPDDIRGWRLERQRLISEYEAERSERIKELGPEPLELEQLRFNKWQTDTTTKFDTIANKAEIRKANSQIIANANNKLRQGDHEGFLSVMEQLDADPVQKEAAIRQGLEDGLYNMGQIQLDGLETIDEIEEFQAWLNEKDSDGNFINMEFEQGGISIGGRTQLQRMGNARINTIQRGQLTEEMRFEREREKGDVGLYDLEQLENQGAVSPEFAEAQRHVLQLETASETLGGKSFDGEPTIVQSIRDEMSLGWVQGFFRDAREPTRAETEAILAQIVAAPISKDGKKTLMNEWLQMKSNDLYNNSEETPGIGNRTVTQPEVELRREAIAHYRGMIDTLGAVNVGRMAQLNEDLIREHFDSNPEATQEEHRAWFNEKILVPMRVREAATNPEKTTINLFE